MISLLPYALGRSGQTWLPFERDFRGNGWKELIGSFVVQYFQIDVKGVMAYWDFQLPTDEVDHLNSGLHNRLAIPTPEHFWSIFPWRNLSGLRIYKWYNAFMVLGKFLIASGFIFNLEYRVLWIYHIGKDLHKRMSPTTQFPLRWQKVQFSFPDYYLRLQRKTGTWKVQQCPSGEIILPNLPSWWVL